MMLNAQKTKAIFINIVIFLLPFTVFSQEKIIPVEINGDEINYSQSQATVLVKGNVNLKYQDVVITCDKATYNVNTNIANVNGNVKIVRDDATVYGENIIYNFSTQNVKMVDMRMISPPIYGHAEDADRDADDKYILKNGYVTTCNLEHPHYKLMAKQIIAYPKVKIIAKNVVMKIGEIPIFYFPYLSFSLKDKSFPFQIIPGKKGDWGYYVLGRWNYRLNDEQRGRLIFDWYQKRGMAGGIVHHTESKKYGEAFFNYYYLDDKLYKIENREKLFDRYPDREDMNPKYLRSKRYKAQFTHDWHITENLYSITEYNKFSDEYFMKDFFEREYDIQPHPLTYNLTTYSFTQSALSVLTQGRVNPFYSETEYLPQLEYDFFQQTLGNTGMYLESKTTSGNLVKKTADTITDYTSNRIYTHNIVSYPKTFGWLYANPYVGNYSVFYSKDLYGDANFWRVALESGMDLSTKLYKVFDVDLNLFGRDIKKIRHIFTPKIKYHYIHPPTVPVSEIIQFDDIDTLQRTETATIALENKWQARNDEQTWDFLYFSPSAEYQINKKEKRGVLDKKGTFLNLIKADLEIYPTSGVSLNSRAQYDCVVHAFKDATLDVTFSDVENKKYSISVGQRYAREYDYNVDTASYSSQTTLDFTYQLTKKLQFKNYTRYEFKTGTFLEQQYAIRQDLHCWWFDFGVDIDKQREGVKDITFWVGFTLKDFPDLHVEFDQTYSGAKSSY